jgi:hypothetical protein
MLHRASRPVLLGAGRPFGNGGDDFAWIDQWSVGDDSSNPRSGVRRPASLATLWVAKEAASARPLSTTVRLATGD